MNDNQLSEHSGYHSGYQKWIDSLKKMFTALFRGGSRGRVQELRTPPPHPWDDLRFSNTTDILPKKKLCGLLALK